MLFKNCFDYLTEWSTVWQLRIANSKCVAHKISTAKTSVTDVCHYKINDCKLNWSDCTRDLGVYIDNDLKFSKHVFKIVHIAHSRSRLILKLVSS